MPHASDRIIEHLKSHARALHRRAPADTKRRHCLTAVARELGFVGWSHVTRVLRADGPVEDFGTLLYPGTSAYWNVWSASYDEARSIREEHGGYLLAYRRHYFVAESHLVAALDLDPDDPDWEAIGRDWVKPRDPVARVSLYDKLIRARI